MKNALANITIENLSILVTQVMLIIFSNARNEHETVCANLTSAN